MERRKRDWLKFGSLVGIALILAAAFVSVVDFPERSEAQQRVPVSLVAAQSAAPVQADPGVRALGDAFSSVAEAVRPAVVFVEARSRVGNREQVDIPEPFERFFGRPDDAQPRRGQGSGFLISNDGYIITNNHVVEGFDRLEVTLYDRRRFSATVVGRDPNTDVAVIKIDARGLPAISFGNSDSIKVGEWVLAIGNPLGREFSFTVTAGIVSGRGRGLGELLNGEYNIQDFIQTDAAINPGNSGGPLVDISGRVVGVNSAIASRTGYYSGYSFAIPINLARNVVQQLIETGRVTRAVLGVAIENVTPEDAEYVGMSLDNIHGVKIQDYSAESPARRAGLQPGDVIVELDGERVEYVAQLQQLVGFKKPGELVDVVVLRRDGERRTFQVRLGEAPLSDATPVASRDDGRGADAVTYEGKLGLAVQPLSATQVAQYPALQGAPRGITITGVDPDGPARDKGLLPADLRRGVVYVITHMDGEEVTSVGDFRQKLRAIRPGSIVSLRVSRYLWGANGETQTSGLVVRIRAAESTS
jgi:serine protease Do